MKKTGKRLGALLLALAMVLSLVPMTALAARVDDGEIAIEAPGADGALAKQAESPAQVFATVTEPENAVSTDRYTMSAGSSYSPGTSNEGPVDYAKDGDDQTHWHTNWGNSDGRDAAKRWIQISLDQAMWLTAFAYYPRQQGGSNGYVTDYRVEVCSDETVTDQSVWSIVSEGSGWTSGAEWKFAQFDAPVHTKHVRFYGVHTVADSGSDAHMTASEVRLVQATEQNPTTVSTTITVMASGTATTIEGATVVVAGQTATTDASGRVTVSLIQNQAYTAAVTAANYASATASVTGGTPTEVALDPLHRTISGTVTTDGSNALEGAKVELVQNNDAKSFVTSVASTVTAADGTYTLNVNSVAAGEYCVRVSKDGYGAKLSSAVTVAAAEITETYLGTDVQLPAIDTSTAKFVYDMTDAVGKRPTLGLVQKDDGSNYVGVDWTDDHMKLSFTDSGRFNNLVKLTGTGVKNGTVEFDATRSANSRRFGLAFRLTDSTSWIYIGQFDSGSGTDWNINYWEGGTEKYTSGNDRGPSFGAGDTRHFKVSIQDDTLNLWIDGVRVFDENYNMVIDGAALPSTAKDVGFVCGNNGTGVPCDITIDNLYIFREDQAQTVTLSGTPALTAKVSDSSGDKDLTEDNDGNKQAFAGDVIKVTCPAPGEGKALGAVTVTETDPAAGSEPRTITATMAGENDNTYFTFTMPEYAVTVTGELKNAFSARLTMTGNARVGSPIRVTTVPSDATASYQWYRIDANNNVVTISDATGANYTPVADDQGKTLKVVVTGTDNYAGIQAFTIPNIGPADTQITDVTIARSTIKMIKNGDGTNSDSTDTANTVVSGNTTTLTATVSPDNATGLADGTVAWTVTNERDADGNETTGVVTLGTKSRNDNVFSMPITAEKNGTATVTATATSANGTTQTDSVTITVVTKVEDVTIKFGNKTVASTKSDVTGEGLLLYANTGLDNYPNSAALTVEVEPGDATTPAFNWSRADGQDTGLFLITGDAADGSRTFTVNDTSDAQKVGAKDFKLAVSSADVGAASDKELTFTATVRRYLQNNVSITGDAKVGSKLQANVNQLVMTTAGKNALSYQWKRGETEITGAASSEYTLTADDYGQTISVVVTADVSTYYEGVKTASTSGTVAEQDGPAAPAGLTGVACTTADNNDGKITGLTPSAAYELQKEGSAEGTWETASSVTADETGAITGLANGNYQVRVPADSVGHVAAGAWSTTITVGGHQEVLYTIAIDNAITGGTVSTQRSSVAEGTEITITVTPDEGYELVANSLTVTGADNDPVTVTENKFSMPAQNVTITARFQLKKITITHHLTGVTCNVGHSSGNNTHEVDWGTVHSITLTADTGYDLPSTVTVTPDVGYTYRDGVITFTQGVEEDITVTATATPKTYAVSFVEMTGLNRPQAVQSVNHGGTYTYTLTPMANYARPETITVTMGGTQLTVGTGYTYNSATGAISISNVTGAVTITATGVRQYNQVTGVSISQTSLEVDSILSSSVQPAGAVVSYQWMSSDTENGTYADIANANAQTYTLKAADVGKYIKVKVTGDRDHNYDGTQTSAAVGPVAAKTVAVTDITLDKTSHTMSVGQTVELTATITPDSATDKAITWRVLAERQDTEVTNATITPVSGSDNKVIVTAVSVGTVRINARTANGLTSDCILTIDRPNAYAVTYMTHNESAQVNISTEDGAVADGSMVEAGKTVTISVTPANEAHFVAVTATANNTAVALTKGTGNTWTFTMPGYPVAIDINVTSEQPSTHTVTFTLNGAALADVTGGTVANNVVTVADNGVLTFKLTVADTAKEVKSVKVDGAAITPVEGVYTVSAITADKAVVVEVGDKGVTPPTVDTTALEAAITAATQAKAGVRTYDTEMDPAEVSRGTKYTTAAAMDTLNAAVSTAEAALNAETQAEVDQAVETLNAAVTAFNATVKTGTKASSSTGSRPSTSTTTTTNPDGSKTTTVTDNRTGTVTATTEKPDGTVEVVEAKQDGTVTETKTDAEGAKTEKVTDPDKNVTITVTDAEGEELAKVELPAELPTTETRFEDVPEGHWADQAIHNAAALELIEGVGDNKFGINSTMTRGALATVLHRLSQGKTDYETTFQDVAQGKFYTEGVAWAAKAGVVKGFNPDIFAPDQLITREQLAVMLARYAKLIGMDTTADAASLDQFADGESTGSWAVDGVAWCVESGILRGKGGSALDPTAQVSRAEAAVMLDRFIALLK